MMREEFKGISAYEYEQLTKAIAEITILIAGADGTVHDGEVEWAEKVTKIRSYNLPKRLAAFYEDVGKDFRPQLDGWVERFLKDPEHTTRDVKSNLAQLNDIFGKMENRRVAYELYLSFLSFARHVARSTGGFLGWGAIGPKEDAVIGLTMIHPVRPPATDES